MFQTNDSSDDETLVKQVLPTSEHGNQPIDINKIPATGEEYLRQVRYEQFPLPVKSFILSLMFSYQSARLPDFQTATKDSRKDAESNSRKQHAWHKLFTGTDSSSTVMNKHTVSLEWQNEQCQAFSDVRNDYFQMRDRLRKLNRNSKATKLKNTNHFWKFCFGNDIPFQSSLPTLELQDHQSTLLPTMMKMITLTQV